MKGVFRTWVEVDLKAIGRNIGALKRVAAPAKAMVVVKGNAYGHGMIPIARAAVRAGADMLAVFTIDEALALRAASIRLPVLALEPFDAAEAQRASAARVDVCVASISTLKALARLRPKPPLSVHLNVETGLGRDGIPLEDMPVAVGLLNRSKAVIPKGLMTHFSGAESRMFDGYTRRQVGIFRTWERALAEAGIHPLVHAAGTAGSLMPDGYRFGLCRFGLGTYGLWPSKETAALGKKCGLSLTPALVWRTRIVDLKSLPKGNSISYDRAHRLKRNSRIAVLPIGYYDGYPRSLSGRGVVLVRGKRVPVLGRVMMNTTIIDVTDVPQVRLGDTVTLIGKDGAQNLSIEEVAAHAGTINYEMVTRINPSIPRLP